MNSNAFIKHYLKEHHCHDGNDFGKVLKIILIALILTGLFVYFRPLQMIREQAIRHFENYSDQTTAVAYYKDTSKNTKPYPFPIRNATITSGYGMRTDPITGNYTKHTGIDIVGQHHAPVKTLTEGQVTFTGYQPGYGNCVEIRHDLPDRTIYSFYAHLSQIKVSVNQVVPTDYTIGLEGGAPNTDPSPGNSTGHHLHFEIRDASGTGHDINPMPWLHT